MTTHPELIDLEHAGWKALSTSGADAAAFYDRVLADDVVMLLPGGMIIRDRAAIVDSMRGAPWTSYDLSDERVLSLGEDGAVVTYRARARRAEGEEYHALFNSTYVRVGDDWRLALHQQTPV